MEGTNRFYEETQWLIFDKALFIIGITQFNVNS